VLASGEGTNLPAILDSVHGRDGVEVVCVASSRRGARALERACGAGVEAEVFAAGGSGDRAGRDRRLAAWLDERRVELVVLAGFMELLSPAFTRRFEQRVINVHPALLPSFPGLHAIEQALEHGVKVTGVTVHFVDEAVDSGPVVLQRGIELEYPADVEEVERRMHEVEHELLPEAIRLIARGALRIDPSCPRRVLIEAGARAGR